MRGIVLAGGLGSRLAPLTQSDNKHYLPVYNKRMIEYPLNTLVRAGIEDVIIVLGGNNPGRFIELLGDGKAKGLRSLAYVYQSGNSGVADALLSASKLLRKDEESFVILGDNYFEDSLTYYLNEGAHIFLKKTSTPWYFGIAEVKDGKVISIEEKPKEPKSDLAIVGAYQFDGTLAEKLRRVRPSMRGELEITDVLKAYQLTCSLSYTVLEGYWSDMGTFESWTEVSQRVAKCI